MNSPIPDDWISAWLDGELSAEERRRFEAELEEDDELRQRVEAYQRLGERLRQLPTHRLPASFASEVVARSAGIERGAANGKVNPKVAEISPAAPIPRSRSWYLAMGAIASLAAVVALAMAFPLWYPAAESQLSLLDEQVASGRVEIKSAAEAAPMPMASSPGMSAPESVASGMGLRGAAGEPNRGLEFGEGSNSMSAMRSDDALDEAPALFGAAGRPGEPGVPASRGGIGAMRQPSDAANGPDTASLHTFSDPGLRGGLGGAGGIGLQGGAGSQSIPDFQGGRPLDSQEARDRGMNWDQIAAGAAGAIIGQAVDRAMRREAPAEAKIVEPAAAPAVASATGGAPATRGGAEPSGSGAAAGIEAGGEPALPEAPLAQADLPPAGGGVGDAPVDELAATGDEAMAQEEEVATENAATLSGEIPVGELDVNPVPIAILALVDSPEVLAVVAEGGESTGSNEPGTWAELSWATDGPEGPIVSVGLASRSGTQQDTEALGHETTDLIANASGAADHKQEALGLAADPQAAAESLHRGEPAAVVQVRVFEIVDSPERIQAMAQRLSALAPRTWELQWGESQSAWAKRPAESSGDLRDTVGLADEEKVLKFRGRELSGEEAFSLIGWWVDATKPTELPWQPSKWERGRASDSQLATRYQLTLPEPERLAEEQRGAAADAAVTLEAPAEGMQQMTLWLVVPVNQPVETESGDGNAPSDQLPEEPEIRAPSQGSETVPMNSEPPAEVPSGRGESGVPRDPMPLPNDPTIPEPDAPTPRPRGDGEPMVEPSVEPMPEPAPEPMPDDPGTPSDVPSPMGDPNPLPSPSDPPSVDPPKSDLSVPGETLQRSEMTL